MPTTTTILNRRSLITRTLAGAAGAAIGATAALPSARAAVADDAELFALLDEEERLCTMVSRIQDEAQRRGQDIPVGRVEIGQRKKNGKVERIFATDEEGLRGWLDPRDLSPDDLEFRESIDRALGISYVLYSNRRDELLEQLRSEAKARARALRAAGVNDLEEMAQALIAQASSLSAKIGRMRPATIEGAIRLLDVDIGDRMENAIAGLREIAGQGAAA